MWRKLKNLFLSCQTYADLSPDFPARLVINRKLRSRRFLSLTQWHESFWQPQGVSLAVSAFVYEQLSKYSGLCMARLRPSDRLEEDLSLSLICWFDWHLQLCEDFWQRFEIDVTGDLNLQALSTLEDLVLFLNQQLQVVDPSVEVKMN